MSLLSQQRILEFFREQNKVLSTIDISKGVDAKKTVLHKKLVALRRKGFLKNVGFLPYPQHHTKLWELTGKLGDA
ncbi:MAG: hypothetical protein KAS04_03890 [Candidatus Aenigmarchaeota archaeon]|nr:hypothetical protein [Candidatus Aenigmarchaeota archaeon]